MLTRCIVLKVLFIFTYCSLIHSQSVSTIIRPAVMADVSSALDLDLRVTREYFKPLFITKYSHTPLGQDPDYYLGLDIDCDRKLFPDCIQQLCPEKLYVAYDDALQRVVGLIVFHQESEVLMEIDLLLIDKEYRRMGLGKKLVQAARAHFKECQVCGVYVFSENQEAVAFYESLGFVNTGPGPQDRQTDYGISYAQLYVYCKLTGSSKLC